MIVSLVFGAFAVSQRNQADRERNVAKQNAAESLTRGLATEAASLTESRHFDEALLVAAQAEETASRNSVATAASQLARTALLNTLTASPTVAGFFDDQPDAPQSLAYSPDGAYLVSTTIAGQFHAWNATTGRALPQPRWHVGGAGGVVGLGNAAVNSAGIMATGAAGGANLALWDLHKNAPFGWQPSVRRPRPAGLAWNSVALSDRGLVAWAFGADPTTLDVWDLTRRRHIGTQLTFPGLPVGLTFSPDGSQLAVTLDHSNSNLTVQLVSVPGMTPGPLLQGQDQPNAFNAITDQFETAAMFSPDGRRVSVVASRGPDRATRRLRRHHRDERQHDRDIRHAHRRATPGADDRGRPGVPRRVTRPARDRDAGRHRHPEGLRPRDRHAHRRATRPTARLQPELTPGRIRSGQAALRRPSRSRCTHGHRLDPSRCSPLRASFGTARVSRSRCRRTATRSISRKRCAHSGSRIDASLR